MTAMDLKKWEHVVLQWVNYLKLSEPIKSVNDLRNGAFFVSLVKVMTLDESPSPETCLTAITQLLRKQYPNFSFQSDSNLEGLLEIDLLAIASLLLHYTCIYDRRDILTSPLCNKLSKTTQICIKTFLESVKNETTKEELFKALEQLVSRCTNPKTLQVLTIPSAGSSSPLQDLLQTPPPYVVILEEKNKEITKLKTAIDFEQYEKLDLQNELHLQKEENEKLSKQVGDKTSEIIRLRKEILELESKWLPHSQDDESRELQCRLQGENSSLKQYIQQLQNEQEQLYTERDTMKEELQKTEGQYKIWHDKVLSTETDFDSLLEKHQLQETELRNLREHCKELSALLEEMQAMKRRNKSVPESDTSVTEDTNFETPCEDLACAVVEVQLRDAQKENAELRGILKESQESAKKLNEDLGTVRTRLEELQTDYEILKSDNQDLLEKERSDSMASVYSGAGETRYGTVAVGGQIKFGLQYNYKTRTFEILIKQCKDLAAVDHKHSNPYVKVYLLPDKSNSGKRKTRVKKHTLNPVFNENLSFHSTDLNDLGTRTLWITVWHSDMFGRNDFLGEVMMSLENKFFDDPTPIWYNLQERQNQT